MIDSTDNRTGGAQLGAFYAVNRVVDHDPFTVRANGGSLPPAP